MTRPANSSHDVKRKRLRLEKNSSKGDSLGQNNEAKQKWYDSPSSQQVSESPVAVAMVKKVKERAESKYKEQVSQFQDSLKMSKSDRQWFVEVTTKGILKDKLAAYAVAVQEVPFFCLEHLDAILNMTGSNNRHEKLAASESLTDILVGNDFLPVNRKLYYIHQRPISSKDLDDKNLILWYFEDRLKTLFFNFLKVLESLLQDNIEYTREKACRLLFNLTKACPIEQQNNTLSLLTNKLGDPNKKLSSRIIFYAEELCKAHSGITAQVISAIKNVISRPGIPEKAIYYGLTFCSNIHLSKKQPEIISSLLSIYLIFFKSVVVPSVTEINKKQKDKRKKNAGDNIEPPRLAKIVLLGLNRALAVASSSNELKDSVGDFMEPLLKLCKMANIGTAVLALSLFHSLYKITDSPIHRSLLFSQISSLIGDWVRLSRFSNSYPALFNLLRDIVESDDKNDGQIEKLVKRVLGSAVHLDTYFILLTLQWLAKTLDTRPKLRVMVSLPPESIDDVCNCTLFELVGLASHYDCRVSKAASEILQSKPMSDMGDLQSATNPHAFISDLERLQCRNSSINNIIESIKACRNVKDKGASKRHKKSEIDSDSIDDDVDGLDDDLSDGADEVEDFEDDVSDDEMDFSSLNEGDSDDGSIDDEDNIFESADELD